MRQASLRMKQRRESRLVIHHSFAAYILGLLVGHALQGFFRLGYGDRVFESFEIFRETTLICALMKPVRQRSRVRRGKIRVANAIGQVDDSFRTQHSIEMFVK